MRLPQCDACDRRVGHTHHYEARPTGGNPCADVCDACLHIDPGGCADDCAVCADGGTHRFSCRHCAQPIRMETVVDGWFHVHDGWTKCADGNVAAPKRSRSRWDRDDHALYDGFWSDVSRGRWDPDEDSLSRGGFLR